MPPFVGGGTGRLAADVPMVGHHGALGDWSAMLHGTASLGYRRDQGPRGDQQAFFTHMLMGTARRSLGPAWLDAAVRLSAEPVVGRRGYPLLLQTGETADGVYPLVDRQHPHDALGELSLTYSLEIEEGAWAFVYVAAAGAPALGPVPYMHRASAAANPMAPLTHHFLDATHVTYGVLTGGIYNGLIQAEASFFNGREPDQYRWLPETPRFDSWSARITLTPGGQWAAQASFGALTEPEQVHPVVDVYRSTLSLSHHVEGASMAWSSTLAWGRNTRRRTEITLAEARARLPAPLLAHYLGLTPLPPGSDDSLVLLFDKRVQSGLLAETSLTRDRVTGFARWERASKDELVPPPDARHSTFYRVQRAEVGAVVETAAVGAVTLSLGASASLHSLPAALDEFYGDPGPSWTVFTTLAF